MPVPEGLAGMRVDAGLARLLGLSRTAVATIAEDGGVDIDGAPAAKSDKLVAGSWLEVRLPEAPAPLENTPQEIEGMGILYSDDDIVAVDKPAGVAAHASLGWTGPTVLGGLAAAGFRISTSGIHERQGIVHRLDAGTSGVMVVALSERAYTVLKRAFKHRTVDKRYHALVQGHPGYLRAMHGVEPLGGTWLNIAAFDLARGPDGGWRVVSQRTQAPSGLGYLLVASLKYRQDGGAVKFTYEMNRADVVHERAAKDVITTVQAGIGETPMLMGAFD